MTATCPACHFELRNGVCAWCSSADAEQRMPRAIDWEPSDSLVGADDAAIDCDVEGAALLATRHAAGVRMFCERRPRVRATGLAALWTVLAIR